MLSKPAAKYLNHHIPNYCLTTNVPYVVYTTRLRIIFTQYQYVSF